MAKLEFGIFDGFSESEMRGAARRHVRRSTSQRAATAERARLPLLLLHRAPERAASPTSRRRASTWPRWRARRSTLRFGPMVYQLPMHHPIRLAQDAAMVDQLSRGRLEFGIGYGTTHHEFMPLEAAVHRAARDGRRGDGDHPAGLDEDAVTYEGEYWSFDEALPKPKPFQQPHPPVWVGAHSTTSFDYAAKTTTTSRRTSTSIDVVAREVRLLRRRPGSGHDHPGPLPHMLLARHVHVAETDAQAREEAEQYLLQGFFGGRGGQIIASTRIGWGGDARGTGGERTPDIDERGRVFQEIAKSYDFWIENGLALVGSPDTVRRMLEDQQRSVGYDVFCTQHQINDLPKDAGAEVTAAVRRAGDPGVQVIRAFS